jgi:hypothetical protein
LPIRIPNAEPAAGNQYGTVAGRLNASKTPVKRALPSVIVIGLCVIHSKSASITRADAQEMRVRQSARVPKKYKEPKRAGIRARITEYIILFVEILLLI